MEQKEEIYKIWNKQQITITKFTITKTDYTKQILIMHYAEYINTFEVFVNKYIVPSINIRMITSFKNELWNAQIVTIG
jgi:hypothetical protein